MDRFIDLILSIPGLLLALTFHEFAHGYVAYRMGDNTAKYQGRLSLNPIHHMDIIGTLCLLFFRFGWAKPVPVNQNNFYDRKKGIIFVSLAGPVANFILAFICYVILKLISPYYLMSKIASFFVEILASAVGMNIGLMIFNLIPIPPLDGSKVLMEFLPYNVRYKMYNLERYSSFLLLILLYTGIISPILGFVGDKILWLFDTITFFI